MIFVENLEIIGNDDSGVSIIYTDANGQLIQNQTLPSLTTVTLSGVSFRLHIIVMKMLLYVQLNDTVLNPNKSTSNLGRNSNRTIR